ncbi:hypothetical protein [Arthrobacter sp.]|uniref:hypothetical protein n=1 Tax=Arthrobacter sp. TaxID=1667 RepID=UPI003A95A6B9
MFDRRGRAAPRVAQLATLAAAAALLSSCAPGAASPGGSTDGAPATPRTPAAQAPTSSATTPEAGIPAHETPRRATSDRGLPLYTPGEAVELEGTAGNPLISLTVTSISVEDTCPVDGGQPEHGAFALLEVEATFEKADDPDAHQRPLALSPQAWSYHPVDGPGFDGDLGTTPAASCQQAGNALPDELKPGPSVHGTLVLDIPERTGSLTLADVDTDIAEWPLP